MSDIMKREESSGSSNFIEIMEVNCVYNQDHECHLNTNKLIKFQRKLSKFSTIMIYKDRKVNIFLKIH